MESGSQSFLNSPSVRLDVTPVVENAMCDINRVKATPMKTDSRSEESALKHKKCAQAWMIVMNTHSMEKNNHHCTLSIMLNAIASNTTPHDTTLRFRKIVCVRSEASVSAPSIAQCSQVRSLYSTSAFRTQPGKIFYSNVRGQPRSEAKLPAAQPSSQNVDCVCSGVLLCMELSCEEFLQTVLLAPPVPCLI